MTASEISDGSKYMLHGMKKERWKAVVKEAKAHKGL
jgi:hypothetical protein